MMQPSIILILLLALNMQQLSRAGWDVRSRLATKTRYAFRMHIPNAPSIYATPDPPGYEPLSIWLLSRHGSRWPTSDRCSQISSLHKLFEDAKNRDEYPWTQNWTNPVSIYKHLSGELHPIGEGELWALAKRLRARFPNITALPYLPKRYPIISTQVARASASASAFASGYFPLSPYPSSAEDEETAGLLRVMKAVSGDEANTLRQLLQPLGVNFSARSAQSSGSGDPSSPVTSPNTRPQAVAITMSPKNQDPLLRFFDLSPQYAQREEWLEKWLGDWMAAHWAQIAPRVAGRLKVRRDVDPCEIEALWQLCMLEGLYDNTTRACSLFSKQDIAMLEWLDDVNLLESHAYGARINYDISKPLAQDLAKSLQGAARAREPEQQARLLFAHCETIIPFATLLGLFKPELPAPPSADMPSETELELEAPVQEARQLLAELDAVEDMRIHSSAGLSSASVGDEGLDVCYKGRAPRARARVPPGWYPRTPFTETRIFRGARIAPYGANMAVVLYRAAAANGRSKHVVRLLYNEQVLPVPGCSSPGLECELEEFLDILDRLSAPAQPHVAQAS